MQKERIAREALVLFRRYGIRSTSMDDISTHLNVSKKTIYQYFRDKEELLLYVIERAIDEIDERLQQFCAEKTNPLIRVANIYRYLIQEIARYSDPYFYDLKKIPPANQRIIAFQDKMGEVYVLPQLREAKEKNLLRPEVNIEMVHRIHLYRLNELMNGLRIAKDPEELDLVFRHLVVYNLRGLLAEKHIRLLDPLL